VFLGPRLQIDDVRPDKARTGIRRGATVASSWPGESDSPGSTGAIPTPASIPASTSALRTLKTLFAEVASPALSSPTRFHRPSGC